MKPIHILPAILGCALVCPSIASVPEYRAVALTSRAGTDSVATALNNTGQVAGHVRQQLQGTVRATLWRHHEMIDLNPQGATFSSAEDLNDAGQVVGVAYSAEGGTQAILWNNTVATVLSPGQSAGATAINQAGQIAGYLAFPAPNRPQQWKFHAALWNGSTAIDLTSSGIPESQATGINNAGQVAGYHQPFPELPPGLGTFQATLWHNGAVSTLSPVDSSIAYAINDHGQVAGAATIPEPYRTTATVWTNGSPTVLPSLHPSTNSGAAKGINNSGQVVGASATERWEDKATLWENGEAINLNDFLSPDDKAAGWVLRSAEDINDQGWIIANARNRNLNANGVFAERGYLLTPIPEPATIALMLAGLGVLGIAANRRQAGRP